MNLWERLRLAKSFEMTLPASGASILNRIEQLKDYKNTGEQKYYRVSCVSEENGTEFNISQHRMDAHDNDVSIVAIVIENSDTTTHISGKIFPSLGMAFFVTITAMFLLSMLLQGYSESELEPPTSYLLAFITTLMVIFSFFHWLSVFVYRQTFDQFLREWLTA
jgi:hypothetical protein